MAPFANFLYHHESVDADSLAELFHQLVVDDEGQISPVLARLQESTKSHEESQRKKDMYWLLEEKIKKTENERRQIDDGIRHYNGSLADSEAMRRSQNSALKSWIWPTYRRDENTEALKRYKAALESKRLSCEEQLDSLKRQRQNLPPCSRDSPPLTLTEALENISELKQMVKGCQSPAVTSIINLHHHNASTHRRSDDLLTYLSHSRTCRSSDRRDRVYAFIGLVGPSYGIVPDYSDHNTIIHVLIDAAQKIIRHDRNLRMLSYAAGTGGTLSFKLPNWVPDWTRERSEAAEALSLALRAAAQTKTNRPTRRAQPVIWTTQYSGVPDSEGWHSRGYRQSISPTGSSPIQSLSIDQPPIPSFGALDNVGFYPVHRDSAFGGSHNPVVLSAHPEPARGPRGLEAYIDQPPIPSLEASGNEGLYPVYRDGAFGVSHNLAVHSVHPESARRPRGLEAYRDTLHAIGHESTPRPRGLEAYRDTIHPIGHESARRPKPLEEVDERNQIPVEFIKGNGREDMLVLKVKGKRVGCLEILDSRAKPVAGKLARYSVVKKTPDMLLGVEAIAPSSRDEGLELWSLLGADHPVVLKRSHVGSTSSTTDVTFMSEARLLGAGTLDLWPEVDFDVMTAVAEDVYIH